MNKLSFNLLKRSSNNRILSNSFINKKTLLSTQFKNYSVLKGKLLVNYQYPYFNNHCNYNSYNQDSTFLTEDQETIQDAAYQFAKNELLPNSIEWDQKSHFPKEVFQQAAELGFASIYTSEENGGAGLGRVEASLIFEALATGDVAFSAYLSIHNMCLWMINEYGNEEQKKSWMPDLISMKRFSSYCLTEPNSGSDAASLKTTAVEKGDDFIINGTKCFISGGGFSNDYLVMCKTGDKEISCIKVDTECKGLSFGAKEKKVRYIIKTNILLFFYYRWVGICNLLQW